jgi:putative transposase
VRAVSELRGKHGLSVLLRVAGLGKSSYFYSLAHAGDRERKDAALAGEIESIFRSNLCKYGSPRVAAELRRRGFRVNIKRVERIMREAGLSALPKRRAYHSYRGEVGKTAPNVLNRDFSTTGPYQKMGTDVTQFITEFGKLYLSPVIDFHTREILAYDISVSPNYAQVRRMLEMLVRGHGPMLRGAILASDQGYQYQMAVYRRFLKEHGIVQSMSRKGNCLDNSPTENFFGRLKTEMYYDREYSFGSLAELKRSIERYIDYWNRERIVGRLGCPPIEARNPGPGVPISA